MRRAGEDIKLTLHLMELTGGGATRFSDIYRVTLKDIFVTQELLAQEIGGDIAAAMRTGEMS